MVLSIAVIGGSISGCMAGAMLARKGHQVCVYERSNNDLVGRGGGIATSARVINDLKQAQLIGPDFPTVPHKRLRLAKKTPSEPALGRCPWGPELDMECVHWSGLFQALKHSLGDTPYRLGKELVNARYDNHQQHLEFADGSTASVDLVVFTDGFRSIGRQLMHPQVDLNYRGFAVWRGTLDECRIEAGSALDDHPRLSLRNMPGSFITYLMPSHTGSIVPGERVINWAAYLPVSDEDLAAYLLDSEGTQRTGTVPAGYFPIKRENELKQLMRDQLPEVFAEIVAASIDTQFQPIRTTRVPSHYHQRMCLVGDAAVAIQPMTGSGAFKAFHNASTLVEALSSASSKATSSASEIDASLEQWSARETALDDKLLATGYAMEKAFIWETIDLASASADAVRSWWNNSIEYPREYSYLKVG